MSPDGLPIGMMLMGRPNADEQLLAVAGWIDRNLRASN
jgi:aspartyl-tRNA(Asn)/glutamyl-tRNA(Gln) amidotransferase subunit A